MIDFVTRTGSFRRMALLTTMLVAVAAAGCDDKTGPDDEPDVQTIRLVIGTGASAATYNITRSGTQPTVVLPRTATAVAATFLRADGSPDPLVTTTEYELRLVIGNTSLATFNRLSAFTGILTGVAAGTTSLRVQLYHLGEGHEDVDISTTLQVQ